MRKQQDRHHAEADFVNVCLRGYRGDIVLIKGLGFRGYIVMMEKKMETTI